MYDAALMLAAMEKHCAVVKALLRQQANVHFQDSKGISALMFAALSGGIVCVTALVEAIEQTDRALLDGQVKASRYSNIRMYWSIFFCD